MIVLASDWARKKKLRKENIRVVRLTWPGRSLVEIGRLERNPGPTISASLHSITVPSLSNLTLNFFSPAGKSRPGLDLMAATTPGRQNPSTHLTVTLAPIIDLFGILFVLAMSAIFSLNGRRPRVSGRSCQKCASAPAKDPATGLFVVGWSTLVPLGGASCGCSPPDFTPTLPTLTDRPFRPWGRPGSADITHFARCSGSTKLRTQPSCWPSPSLPFSRSPHVWFSRRTWSSGQ